MANRVGTLADFIAAGNEVFFKGGNYSVDAQLVWYGTGNYIEIGKDIKFNKTRITFLGNDGKLILGNSSVLKGYLVIGENCSIQIGERVFINRVSDIRALESCEIVIEKDCLFSDVGIFTSDMHSVVNLSNNSRINNPQSIKIEERVWLAEAVRVSKGALIGAGSIIGGRSIVNGKIPPYCLAVGAPAKVVKEGISWDRNQLEAEPKSALEFTGKDIPLNKEIIRNLISDKRYSLVYAVVEHHASLSESMKELPSFAIWYYLLSKSKVTALDEQDIALLHFFIQKFPTHKSAKALGKSLVK